MFMFSVTHTDVGVPNPSTLGQRLDATQLQATAEMEIKEAISAPPGGTRAVTTHDRVVAICRGRSGMAPYGHHVQGIGQSRSAGGVAVCNHRLGDETERVMQS